MNTKLKLIEGGLLPKEKCERIFISAYVTDTRLMGVLGMYVHWGLKDCYEAQELHQFFYFDAEDYGLEAYQGLWGGDIHEIQLIEQSMINPLGGKKIDISQKEAAFLLKEYINFNKKRNLPMPSPVGEYKQLLDSFRPLSEEEKSLLDRKLYTGIHSEYQLIHYFLMRCFSKDREGALQLCHPDVPLDIYDDFPAATFCKNIIDEKDGWFLAESLIEFNNRYTLTVSRIKVEDMKVSRFRRISSFPVTAAEAGLMLSRPEFITVYEIMESPDILGEESLEFQFNTAVTLHDNGKLFLAFNDNNDHVDKRIFRLSEDVFGLYYITDTGQFLVASYDIKSIKALEKDLLSSSFGRYLLPIAKYEFKEPVLYDFIQSGYEYFEDFLDDIQGDED